MKSNDNDRASSVVVILESDKSVHTPPTAHGQVFEDGHGNSFKGQATQPK